MRAVAINLLLCLLLAFGTTAPSRTPPLSRHPREFVGGDHRVGVEGDEPLSQYQRVMDRQFGGEHLSPFSLISSVVQGAYDSYRMLTGGHDGVQQGPGSELKLSKSLQMFQERQQPSRTQETQASSKREVSQFGVSVNDGSASGIVVPFDPDAKVDCSHVGVPYLGIGAWDKCSGRRCTLGEVECGGVVTEMEGYSGDLSNCVVSSLMCPEKVTVPYQMENSGEEVEACEVISFRCGGVELSHSEVNAGQRATCPVQVRCGARVYGYDAFDFECYSEVLVCNGRTVPPEELNSTRVSDDCHFAKVPCKDVSDQKEECATLSDTCSVTPFENFCPTQVHHSTCNKGSCMYVPHSLRCGGQVVLAKDYTGPIEACESLVDLECSGEADLITVGSNEPTQICRVATVSCAPLFIPSPSTSLSIDDGCGISSVICTDVANPLGCTMIEIGCDADCFYTESLQPCQTSCIQAGITQLCDCPYSYYGFSCENKAPLQCDATLISPRLECLEDDKEGRPGFPSCLRMESQDKLDLTYQLSCSLGNPQKTYSAATVAADQFNYTYIGDDFALTEPLANFTINSKLYNFNNLRDISQGVTEVLTEALVEGKVDLHVPVVPSDIPAKYRVGGRVYLEIHLRTASDVDSKHSRDAGSGNTTKSWPVKRYAAKQVVDITDMTNLVPRVEDTTVYWVVAIMSLVLLGLMAGGFFFYRHRQKKVQEARELKKKRE